MTAVVVSEQQLTRRQLREIRQAAVRTPAIAQDLPVPERPVRRDFVQTEVLPIPSRKDLHRVDRSSSNKRTSPSHAPRAAIVATLGIVTIAAPLTGFVTPQQSAHAVGTQVATATPLAESVAASAAAGQLEGTIQSPTALTANPHAAAIALDLSARDQARTISACTAVEGASGLREASVERSAAINYPMASGTYRNTSLFGPRWGRIHSGTDMAASVGTPIFAVTDGVVVHSGDGIEGRSGKLIIIQSVVDGQNVWFWYGHMYDNGVYVSEGDTVAAGQRIAGVGSNGYSTGPHLHFEVHAGEWSNLVDPLAWLSDAGAASPGTC